MWWIVLLGALAGVLPARIGAAGWAAIGLLAGFALWSGLAIGWSESAERSTIELARVATYLGVLVLAIAVQGRTAARHTINGLACAIGLVTLLAVLSRLHPQWFPANDHFEFLGAGSARKLSYPLNYWNALAAFAAIGVPLLLGVAIAARTLAGQALAAAMLPVSALCVYLTISRGGTLALAVGIVVFLLFVPRRLNAIGTLLVAGAGSAILLAGAAQRDAVQDGVVTAAARQQGTELIWLAVIVCAGVALLQVAIGLAARHLERPALLAPSRRAVIVGAVAALAIGGAIGIAAGAPGAVEDQWQEFKAPAGSVAAGAEDNVISRLSGVNGNGRYQAWQAALDANQSAPWQGIGPGTFEFWWARDGTGPGFIRDAHTLYFETLAETGIVGLLLLGGLLAFLLGTAVVRSLRASVTLRTWIAAAVAGFATFLTSAAFEWVWEMAAIGCVVMLLGALILCGRDDDAPVDGGPDARRRAPARRAGVARARRAGRHRRPDGGRAGHARQPSSRGRRAPGDRARGQRHGPAPAAVRRHAALAARARARAGGRPRRGGVRRAQRGRGGAHELAHVVRPRAHRGATRQRCSGALRAADREAAQPAIAAGGWLMSDLRDDLGADAPRELIELAERLERERPLPAAAFRGDLRRRLVAGRGPARSRPARLRVLIAGYATAGSVLLLAGVASVAGIGPLGA